MALNQYDSCPFKKQKRHQEDVNTEKSPCEDTGRQGPSVSQGEALEESKYADTLILDFSIQNCENINFVGPVCDILLHLGSLEENMHVKALKTMKFTKNRRYHSLLMVLIKHFHI